MTKILVVAPSVLLGAGLSLAYFTEWATAAALGLVSLGLGFWFREVHIRTQKIPGLLEDVKQFRTQIVALRDAYVEHLRKDEESFGTILRKLDSIDQKLR
jgi:hypothetical protein